MPPPPHFQKIPINDRETEREREREREREIQREEGNYRKLRVNKKIGNMGPF